MNNSEIEDIEIKKIREKILSSEYEYKKKIINNDLEEIKTKLKNMSPDEIRKIIDKKISQIKDEKLEEKEIEKLECEIAVLLSSLPINVKNRVEYWKGKEKNARNKKSSFN